MSEDFISLIDEDDIVMETAYFSHVKNSNQLESRELSVNYLSNDDSLNQEKTHKNSCCHHCFSYYIATASYIYTAMLAEPNKNYRKFSYYNRIIMPLLHPPKMCSSFQI